jgi:uncharacterized membrane protein
VRTLVERVRHREWWRQWWGPVVLLGLSLLGSLLVLFGSQEDVRQARAREQVELQRQQVEAIRALADEVRRLRETLEAR